MQTGWKRLIMAGTLAGCAVVLLTGLRGRAQSGGRSALPHYILLEREAIVAQSPQVVAQGDVDLAAWSPDGRNVLVFRTDMGNERPAIDGTETPPVEVSVVLWNLATKRGLTVWKHRGLPPADGRSISSQVSWLPNSQIALLPIEWRERSLQPDAQGGQKIVDTPHHALLLIDAAHNQVREVAQSSWLPFAISPVQPQIALHDTNDNMVRILDGKGALGLPLALPKQQYTNVDWMPDGSALLLRWLEKAAPQPAGGEIGKNAKPIQRYARMDTMTGAITPLDKAPARIARQQPLSAANATPLHIHQTMQMLSEGMTHHRAHPLWLESDVKSDQMRTLLCADGANAQLSPRGDAALYLSQGVAWVTPLTRVPREAFVQALRVLLMRNAKQAGLAMIMYSQDYDEILPPSGDVISPYLRDDNVLDGLNYSYGGGALKDIEKPAETILATYPGPGGVVTIYADGHVRWHDKDK